MDLNEKQNKKPNFAIIFEKLTGFINIGLIITIVLLAGLYISKNIKSPSEETQKQSQANSENNQIISIDISGAILKPGVYQMKAGERITDIISKSGGYTSEVDIVYIEKNINQAEKLRDSQKIYIPRVNDQLASSGASMQTKPLSGETSTGAAGRVSINSASKSELEALPEIGEVTADKIIASRPYSDITQLVDKGALKQVSYDKIKDKLSL